MFIVKTIEGQKKQKHFAYNSLVVSRSFKQPLQQLTDYRRDNLIYSNKLQGKFIDARVTS